MNLENTILEAFDAINNAIEAFNNLKPFVSDGQLAAMKAGCHGEEGQYFIDTLLNLDRRIETMPKTYEQDGKGMDAIAYLHYFRGGMDWYITEKDTDEDGEGQQQAFGLADLGYGAELGYISIQELIDAGVELDLHFEPTALSKLRS